MPVYEYTCLGCNKKQILLLKQADEKRCCPDCGGELRRLISRFAIGKTEWETPFTDSQYYRGLKKGDPSALAEYGRRAAGGGPTGPEYTDFLNGIDD